MSESSFPFGGTAVAEPPVAPVVDDSVAGPDRRKLLLVGGVAGVLLLAVAAYFLLFSGGGSANDTTFVVPHHAVKKPAATAPKAIKPVAVPKTNAAPVGRDPFKALVAPPAPAASAAPAGAPAPSASAAPVAPVAPAGATQTKPVTPTWIELDSFTATSATFRVAYTDGSTRVWQNVKAPAAGKTTPFATYFALLKLSGGVATVQMGDGKPFALKQGFANRHFFG
jgi:hypothetical protein